MNKNIFTIIISNNRYTQSNNELHVTYGKEKQNKKKEVHEYIFSKNYINCAYF